MPGGPCPLAHPVEALVPPGRRGSSGTPRARGCSGGRGRCPSRGPSCRRCSRAARDRPRGCRPARSRLRRLRGCPPQHEKLGGGGVPGEAPGVRRVGDEHARRGVAEAVADPLVAVEHRHRQEECSELPRREEHGRRLGGGRKHDRHAVTARHAERGEHVCALVGEVLELSPAHLAHCAREVLVNHRELLPRDACRTRPPRY